MVQQSDVQTGVSRPETADPAGWRAYWKAIGVPWRIEPEVSVERMQVLTQRLAAPVNIGEGSYPFSRQPLGRADIEWLLVTHDNQRGPVDWADAAQQDRTGLDLRGADLRGVDLRGLPLARVRGGAAGGTTIQQDAAALHLEGARLAGAQLQGAELSHAHLEGADLHGALLDSARLRGAVLQGADLRKARLQHADLRNASLQQADLREANLTEARMQVAYFEGARLGAAVLDGAVLDRAHFDGALLQTASLVGASCKGTHFTRAYLRHTHLEGTNLHRASLDRMQLEGAFLHGAELRGAYLQGTNLYGAELTGKVLTPEEAERLTRLRQGIGLPGRAVLPPADLRGAFLDQETNLRHTRLGSPELGYASVADLTWGGANLSVLEWIGQRSVRVVLGDEREALSRTHPDGTRKDRATRLKDYTAAVRANRQLAVALRAQGLDEEAGRFAYRAQVLQRRVALRQGRLGAYTFSALLDAIAGYGYKPGRSLLAYLIVIFGWAVAYLLVGHSETTHLSVLGSVIFSVTSFHGRGFFPGGVGVDDPLTVLAASEAVVGLFIELSFIATFTQRFFGK
jgi:uncharacterized protein YjbI with pentapeptide repeats